MEVVSGSTRLVLSLWPRIPLCCLGIQAFRFQLVNSKLFSIGLAWILPQEHSGKVSCQNFTVDTPIGQTRAFRSKCCPFWLNFGYVVPEIKYIPKLIELIRYNSYGMIMSYVS